MADRVKTYAELLNRLNELDPKLFSISLTGPVATPDGPRVIPLIRTRIEDPSASPSVYLSGGIHGDEPAGVWAILDFLERFADNSPETRATSFMVFPCLNPYGFDHGTRANGDGIDLNRRFRLSLRTAEVRSVTDSVGGTRFDFSMELHEDVDASAFYMYELVQSGEPPWGRRIIDRLRVDFPIHDSNEIEGSSAHDGLIFRNADQASFRNLMEERSDWPQAFFHFKNGTRRSFTTETPITLSPDERVRIHLTALETAISCLWERRNQPVQ